MSSKDTDPWSPILRVRHALVGDKDGLLEVWHDRRGSFDGIPWRLIIIHGLSLTLREGTSQIDCPLCTRCMLPDTISSPGQTSGVIDCLVPLGLRFSNFWRSDADKMKRTLSLAHY